MKSKMKQIPLLAALALCASVAFTAESVVIELNEVNEKGEIKALGTVTATESKYGIVFTPDLQGITPGTHGFHLHVNPDCGPQEKDGKMVAALAAGGHWDPDNMGKHSYPWDDNGHKGDLPALVVDADGKAVYPVLAPKLKLSDLAGHSLMIHADGENHSDHPKPLGGGGARMACGVIK